MTDDYLLEQQKELDDARFWLRETILSSFVIATLLSLTLVAIPLVFYWEACYWVDTPEDWQSTELVLDRVDYFEWHSRYSLNYNFFIFGSDGSRFALLVDEDKFIRLREQLTKGQTYTLIYAPTARSMFTHRGGNNRLRENVQDVLALSDADQQYITLEEGSAITYDSRISLSRGIVFYFCSVIFAYISVFACNRETLRNNYQKIRLHKKLIKYYCNNESLPEKLRQQAEACKKGPYDTAAVFPQLHEDLQQVKDDYELQKTIKRFFAYISIGSFALYFPVLLLLLFNCPTEDEWQSREIIISEISYENYIPGFFYTCLYDDEGNCYKLTPTTDYQSYYLQKQLTAGDSCQIEYGCNRWLFSNQKCIYQLKVGNETYITKEETYDKFIDICLFGAIAMLAGVVPAIIGIELIMFSLYDRETQEKRRRYIEYNEGALSFYEYTAIDITEIPPAPVKKTKRYILVNVLSIITIVVIAGYYLLGFEQSLYDYEEALEGYYDPVYYTQNYLDCDFHAVYDEEYINSLYDGTTVKSAREQTEAVLQDYAVAFCAANGAADPSAATLNNVRELYRSVFLATSYEVKDFISEEDCYKVTVIVKPLQNADLDISGADAEELADAAGIISDAAGSDAERQEIIINEFCRETQKVLSKPQYGEPQTVYLTIPYGEICRLDYYDLLDDLVYTGS